MKKLILNAFLIFSVLGVGLAATGRRGVSKVSGAQRGGDLALLERQSAMNPGDASAAVQLMRHYVEQGEAGMALSVADRTPSAADRPAGRDLVARALFSSGRASDALTMTRRVIQECEHSPCDATLLARATRREELLTELVDVGVEDADKAPELVQMTYRRTTRTIRVAASQ